MSKDPSFPMYARDWLVATRTMSPAARGAYIDLLCHQWLEGSLPTETHRLRRVCAMDEKEFLEVWPEIEPHFKMNCVGLVNNRLQTLREERDLYLEKQKTNGMKGGRPKTQTKPTGSVRVNPNHNPNETSASASAIYSSSEEYPPLVPPGDFDSFWKIYPRRQGSNPKAQAKVAYEKAIRGGAHPDEIYNGARQYAASLGDDAGTKFVAQAVTWLNQKRWADEYVAVEASDELPVTFIPPKRGPDGRLLNAEYE